MSHFRRGIMQLLAAAIGLLAAIHAPAFAADESSDLVPVLNVMDHYLSPGDYLLVQFFDGREQQEYNVQVDTAGQIKLPLVGALQVAGMGLRGAAEMITKEYLVYYKQPVVSLQLLEAGQFQVFVYGPDQPGQMLQLDNGAQLLDVLEKLELTANPRYRRLHLVRGGFDYASLAGMARSGSPVSVDGQGQTMGLSAPAAVCRSSGRNVSHHGWQEWINERLESPQSSVWVIDPLELTLEGNISELNIQLANHDVIYLPAPQQSVDLLGVSRSGRYELLPGETLGDILRLTGSHNILTDLSNTMVRRYDSSGALTQWILNLEQGSDSLEAAAGFELKHNDVVQVATRENRVFVLGEVFESGAFDFRTDATVLDYIALAKGHTPDANLAWIAIIRPPRNRIEPLEQADIVRVNFKEIHKGHPLATDIYPLPGDVVYVPPKGYEFKFENIVQAYSSLMTTFAVIESTNDNSS